MSGNVGRVSDWYWRHQLGELLAQLEEGDLLEFDEGFYKHWAVYVGRYCTKIMWYSMYTP